jgi:hypothetical protein
VRIILFAVVAATAIGQGIGTAGPATLAGMVQDETGKGVESETSIQTQGVQRQTVTSGESGDGRDRPKA